MKAAPWPEHCGRPDCDPGTRMVEVGDDRIPRPCPCREHGTSLADLAARETALQAELDEVRRRLAAVQAPDWARGPGPVPA